MAGKSILVYIEGEGGGGTVSKHAHRDGEFRQAWKTFLQPLADQAENQGIYSFRCIPGLGGSSTTDRFAHPLPQQSGALRILIIDSEIEVPDVTKPWNVKSGKPDWAGDQNCYLMVQCLETWLLADPRTLEEHYNSRNKPCFRASKLKAWPNLEKIPRKTVQKVLEDATADCGKPYGHADGNLIIAKVQRDTLKKLSSVARLFRDFALKIDEYAAQLR